MTPEQQQSKIIAGIIQAQVGSPGVSDLIDKHIEEYFTRFKSYKDKFTYLEWYHIFLDFADKIPALSTPPASQTYPRWVKCSERVPQLPTVLPKDTLDERGILFVSRMHTCAVFWFPSYGYSVESQFEIYKDKRMYDDGFELEYWEWLSEDPAPPPVAPDIDEAKGEIEFLERDNDQLRAVLRDIASGKVLPELIARQALERPAGSSSALTAEEKGIRELIAKFENKSNEAAGKSETAGGIEYWDGYGDAFYSASRMLTEFLTPLPTDKK